MRTQQVICVALELVVTRERERERERESGVFKNTGLISLTGGGG